MPFYIYRCLKCKKEFEEYRAISNCNDVSCPSCLSDNVIRLLNSVPVHYKGKGFYSTDYGRKK